MPFTKDEQAANRLGSAIDGFIHGDYRMLWFVTLTSPGTPTLKHSRDRFAKLRRQMESEFGRHPGLWVIEVKPRTNRANPTSNSATVAHFHFLYQLNKPPQLLTQWLMTHWYPAHHLVGDKGKVVVKRAYPGVKHYMSKGSDVELPDGSKRFGVWGTGSHLYKDRVDLSAR